MVPVMCCHVINKISAASYSFLKGIFLELKKKLKKNKQPFISLQSGLPVALEAAPQ